MLKQPQKKELLENRRIENAAGLNRTIVLPFNLKHTLRMHSTYFPGIKYRFAIGPVTRDLYRDTELGYLKR